MRKNCKIVISLIMSVVMLCSVVVLGTATMSADTATGVGLSAYCLNAYNEQWDYVWGGITPGAVDCTGLVYSYHGVGGIRTDMLSSSSEWGYVSNGIPRIHGLGLHMPGHVGVYVGSGLEVDARSSYDDMCYGSVWDLGWVEWFKVYGVSYPTTGWVRYNGNSFYYENGQYIINTSRTFDGVTYYFDSKGYSDSAPDASAYEQTDYSGSSSGSSSNSSSSSSFLKNGSSGERVKDLQTKLQKLGYFTDGVTGYFGDYTEKVLIEFQEDAGIEVDGIAGPEVFAALDSDDAPTKNTDSDNDKEEETTVAATTVEEATEAATEEETVEATEEPTEPATEEATEATEATEAKAEATTAQPETSTFGTEPEATEPTTVDDGILRFGDTDTEVTTLQERLFELRYFTEDITGIFDDATLNAVHTYLSAAELSATDEVTPELYSLILSTGAVVSPNYNNLQKNYVGVDVKELNSKLIKTGYLKATDVSNTFDSDTETAVKIAQGSYNMEKTGIADSSFKAELDKEANVQTTTSSSNTTTITRTTQIGNKALDTIDTNANAVTNVASATDTKNLYQLLICVAAAMLVVSISATCYFIVDKKRKQKVSRTRVK